MKRRYYFLPIAFLSTVLFARGQGTFIYDQQSADEQHIGGDPLAYDVRIVGQSFTPTLSSVGFIRLFLFSPLSTNDVLYVNLRADSMTGTILGSTDPLVFPGPYPGGFNTFFFSTPVAVTPGTTYFFQPVVQTGTQWVVGASSLYNYPGGTAYANGIAQDSDLWFREGIVVPEPATWALLILGLGLAAARKQK